jgi:GT2 family glycosyltransferase
VSGGDRVVDLSIILVNWKSLPLTAAALASVIEHTRGIAYEIVVVDNGSRDGSVEALRARFPSVTVIENPDNRGFSKANNQGLRVAAGRYVVLLNNDTLQIENALGNAVRYMDAHPDVGALGIRHFNADESRSLQPSCFAFPQPWRDIAGVLGVRSGEPVDSGPVLTERDVDWICGSFLLVRRACLEEVGLLDERFFIYDEDIDWCRRAWRLGWRIRFWPGTGMIHLGAAARPYMRDKTFVHFRSHLSYIAKHYSSLAALLYYVAMSARLTGATIQQAVRFAIGMASAGDLSDRVRRQMQFVLLASGRRGG